MCRQGVRMNEISSIEQTLATLGSVPIPSQWCFDLACQQRQAILYHKVSILCGAEMLLDMDSILKDLWVWLLDGQPLSVEHFQTIQRAIPFPKGIDFRGFRLDSIKSLYYNVTNILSQQDVQFVQYEDLRGLTAEANFNLIQRFLVIQCGQQSNHVGATPLEQKHPLILREETRQLEDIQLLQRGKQWSKSLGLELLDRCSGYDLLDGQWFSPETLTIRS